MLINPIVVTGNFNAAFGSVYVVNSASDVTCTLPVIAPNSPFIYIINIGTGAVILQTQNENTIQSDSNQSYTLVANNPFANATIINDGYNTFIFQSLVISW